MTGPDLINGAFELWGGVFIFLNILQLLRDKQVKGIHWGSSLFFTSWGVWNLWYYPHLGQWASFAGGAVICGLNVVWLFLRIRYFMLAKPVKVFMTDFGPYNLRVLWAGKKQCWACEVDGWLPILMDVEDIYERDPRDWAGVSQRPANPQRVFLRHLVDVAFNEATDSLTVPSTKWADQIIDKALRGD
ncbi:hypothetical protein [uncultured Paludibaculum sp.]|uniref:hypothetical protein n=1 Tax=uncultured Paludibaculum sp. TaxID=1765020 RepID=UPI002AAC48AE|nr:hypothetical protein [uncultured Paludibaculum sp.]